MKSLLLILVGVLAIGLASPVFAHEEEDDAPKGWPFDLSLGLGTQLTGKEELDLPETIVYDLDLLLRFGSFVSIGGGVGGNWSETSVLNFHLRGDLYVFGDNYALTPFGNLVLGSKIIDLDQEVPNEWVFLARPGAGVAFRNSRTSVLFYLSVDYLDSEHIFDDPISTFVNVALRGAFVQHFGG